MKQFMDKDFLLQTETAQKLYHEHAARMPIIDYHCHLDPAMVADDHRFASLTELWLGGDHYKWRAMRTNGVAERYCTGTDTSDWEKFEKWAETVPYTMRNPLYHWTHLELRTAFGIHKLLSPRTARDIYDECNAKLQTPEYSARNLMRRYRVEVVCTTDDPADSLEHHIRTRQDGFEIKMLPTWRPDKLLAVDDPAAFRAYVERLGEAADVSISTFGDLMDALAPPPRLLRRAGLPPVRPRAGRILRRGLHGGRNQGRIQQGIWRTCTDGGRNGPVQVGHARRLRRNGLGKRLDAAVPLRRVTQQQHPPVPPAGTGHRVRFHRHFQHGTGHGAFFDRLDRQGKLAKTIVYNLNPADNEMLATMMGNFQDGTLPGKMQFGSGWWFLDQKDGMERQMNALSLLGLLSRFVGMLTDSRSFPLLPRHEYFRRTLCNLIGSDVEAGLLPAEELDFIGQMVENISYYNAKHFFQF